MPLQVHVDGIGLYGPGLAGWASTCEVLGGRAPYEHAPTRLPPVESLPPAERRRVGQPIKLSMAIGFEAVRAAGADPSQLSTVFSSTGGDCDNCHNILEALAAPDRAVSPTRFQNSVHNAPSGYWSIATACMAPSTTLCAYDATFSAGLLEAATQALSSGQPCLLLAYDTAYPEPLNALRPIPDAMGVAMVLNPVRTPAARALLAVDVTQTPATPMADERLEALRQRIPTGRSLPLLQLLAQATAGRVIVEYIESINLAVEVRF
ncbi:MAG TPA: beta-ketoacyl synthase chain length factor [Burkholderiaceae bacterium]